MRGHSKKTLSYNHALWGDATPFIDINTPSQLTNTEEKPKTSTRDMGFHHTTNFNNLAQIFLSVGA
jgi:hypothetical protein